MPSSAPTMYRAILLSRSRVYVEEGRSASYTVVLASEPEANVIVDVEIASHAALLSITTTLPLNFTRAEWAVPKSVELTTTQNDDDSGYSWNDVDLVHSARSSDIHYNATAHFAPSNAITLRIYDDDACVRQCAPGSYFSFCNNNTLACLPSPPGYYSLGQCAPPVPCPRGSFLPTSGGSSIASCQNCSLGNYASNLGSTSCQICPAGYEHPPAFFSRYQVIFFDARRCLDGVTPEPCQAGMYSKAGDGTCTTCELGRYNTKSAQSTCYNCPPGCDILSSFFSPLTKSRAQIRMRQPLPVA